ncbi:DUF6527 family protein [Sphingomonas sp. LY54]|uniref:DUF6527 family protein n=1 Tax=Sphingomonas sp. LY54 TaxID=3095343 RepID=UPI003A7F34A7
MPAQLEPGVLYVSEEYETAAHLCACGCRSKVRTPLGPTEWSFFEAAEGPTLNPSIGNWQRPCKSHYWIINGRVEWSTQWSSEQIAAGRACEQRRRERHYANLIPSGHLARLWRWLKGLCGDAET